MGVLARRRAAAESSDGPARYEGLEADRSKLPNLVAFLVDSEYSDGTPRDSTGTVSISCDAGGVRVRICDRDAGEVAFKTADSVLAALKQVDKWLGDDSLEWRMDAYAKKRKK